MLHRYISAIILSICVSTLASEIDKRISDSIQTVSKPREMIVTAKKPNSGFASTKVLLANDFKNKYQDLGSLLSTVSGITIYRTGGLGAYSTVQIRGSAANQVQIYLDGIPLNTANGGAVDIGKIPLGSLQEITVYKSSAPLHLIGSNAGAIIELRSKPGKNTDITAASGEVGSFGYRKAGALVNRKIGNITHWFSTEFSHSENEFPYDWDITAYKDGNEIEKIMDNQYYTGASGLYGFIFNSLGKYQLSSQLSFNHTENGIFCISTADSNDGFVKNNSISGLVRCQFFLNDNSNLNINITGKTQNNLFQRESYPRSGKKITNSPYAEISATLMNSINSWLITKTFLAAEFNSYMEEDLWNRSLGELYCRRVTARAGLEVSLDASRMFRGSIKGILRYELDSTNGNSLTHKYKDSKPVKVSSIFPGTEAAINLKLLEPLSFYTSCQYRFRSPGFSEKFASTEISYGNEELRPEKRMECEAGLIFQAKRIRMSIVGYNNRIIDKIIFASTAMGFYTPLNLGEVHGLGLEYEVDFSLCSWIKLSNMLTLMRNIIYSEEYRSRDGKYEPYLPSFQDHCSVDISFWKLNFNHSFTLSNGYYTDADNVSANFYKPTPELSAALTLRSLGPVTLSYRLDNYLKGKLYQSEGEGRSVEHTEIYFGNPKPGRMHTIALQLSL